MVSAQHSPVPGQVLKVVHDDSNEQVNDLKKKGKNTRTIQVILEYGSSHLLSRSHAVSIVILLSLLPGKHREQRS